MISRWILLALFGVALSPTLLRAEQPLQRAGATVKVDIGSDDPRADPKMYEDIEIFRRILDRKLHSLYPQSLRAGAPMMGPPSGGMMGMSGANFQGGMMGMPGGFVWVEEVGNPVEGVYLKGQGVVYTATLSSLQPPRSSGKMETPQPVSEWDSFRREVRNEKEKPKPPAASKPPELGDLLLKVLAENGRHFAQLGANENLTIVITVHEKSTPSTDRKPAGQPAQSRLTPKNENESKVVDLELLGDLHMKQGHYGQARDAFREALARKPGRAQAEMLARKLAQAYLMLDKVEEARAALDQAIALVKEGTDVKDKPVSKPATAVLPVKLIVSAPKNLLDQAGEKRVTFEEFRRRASVETLRFGDSRR
jgi:tetratricopeptide (TPR) repeat protein